MKINCTGLNYSEGKTRYDDAKLNALKDKFNPEKFTPFYAEITKDDFIHADVIALSEDNIWDLLILDMEKCETRKNNTSEEREKNLLDKCLEYLENETPLGKAGFDEENRKILNAWSFLSMKPVLVLKETPPLDRFIEMALDESGTTFFYTSGLKEVHAWHIKKGTEIVECAAKIHSDLARGFVKGVVAPFEDFMECHSMNDALSKGAARLVNRDYKVKPGEVIEIRSSL